MDLLKSIEEEDDATNLAVHGVVRYPRVVGDGARCPLRLSGIMPTQLRPATTMALRTPEMPKNA